jgi:hypothetical protein
MIRPRCKNPECEHPLDDDLGYEGDYCSYCKPDAPVDVEEELDLRALFKVHVIRKVLEDRERLRAENERLRKALVEVSSIKCPRDVYDSCGCCIDKAWDIAKTALEGKDEETD